MQPAKEGTHASRHARSQHAPLGPDADAQPTENAPDPATSACRRQGLHRDCNKVNTRLLTVYTMVCSIAAR
jgi:hypothetical protein